MQSNPMTLLPVTERSVELLRQSPAEFRVARGERGVPEETNGHSRVTERSERAVPERTDRRVREGGERAESQSFREVLDRVTETREEGRQARQDSNANTVAEIEKKIDNISKKIEQIRANPELSAKTDVEELAALVEKLKAYLKQVLDAPATTANVAVVAGAQSDFLKLIEGMLDQLDKLLEDPQANAAAIAQAVKVSGAKMSEGFDKFKAAVQASAQDNEQTVETGQTFRGDASVRTGDETRRAAPKVEIRDFRSELHVKKADTIHASGVVKKETNTENTLQAETRQANTVQTANADVTRRDAAVIQQVQTQTLQRASDPAAVYTQSSAPLARANIEALMQGIAGKAFVTLRDGSTEFKMRLFPPELGGMHMKFVLEDGVLVGKVVVSTQEAKMLFDQNQQNLQQSLAQAGITLGGLDVSFSGDESAQESQQQASAFARSVGMSDAEVDGLAPETAPYLLYTSSVNLIA